MADFEFLQVPHTNKWVIADPNRAKRPNVGHHAERVCPFCIGLESQQHELYRLGGRPYDKNWHIRVIENKFPFAPIHEVIIHSPDHHKNFEELPQTHVELILQTYRQRYVEHARKGQVYIFHNRGTAAGESLPHPHTQLAVVPNNVKLEIEPLDVSIYDAKSNSYPQSDGQVKFNSSTSPRVKVQNGSSNLKVFNLDLIKSWFIKDNTSNSETGRIETESFIIFCPLTSRWSDEVWIAPRNLGRNFGEINNAQIRDLAFCLQRIITVFDLRHGHEFPFNFYIYPGKNWYLRLIPRIKIIGGFEMGTGIIVNTQDPRETFAFLKEHFFEPNLRKIRIAQQADYWKAV